MPVVLPLSGVAGAAHTLTRRPHTEAVVVTLTLLRTVLSKPAPRTRLTTHGTLNTTQRTPWTHHRTHGTLNTSQNTLDPEHITEHTEPWTHHRTHWTLNTTQRTRNPEHNTEHTGPWTQHREHPEHITEHTGPWTHHRTHGTLNTSQRTHWTLNTTREHTGPWTHHREHTGPWTQHRTHWSLNTTQRTPWTHHREHTGPWTQHRTHWTPNTTQNIVDPEHITENTLCVCVLPSILRDRSTLRSRGDTLLRSDMDISPHTAARVSLEDTGPHSWREAETPVILCVLSYESCFSIFGELFLIRCEVKGQGCRMCTDCKALWGEILGFIK